MEKRRCVDRCQPKLIRNILSAVCVVGIAIFIACLFYQNFKPNTDEPCCQKPKFRDISDLNNAQECDESSHESHESKLQVYSMDNNMSCYTIRHKINYSSSGVYSIFPLGDKGKELRAYCDMESLCGGWTVFQRRGIPGDLTETNRSELFNKTWASYKTGFGGPNSDYWLGLDAIRGLTKDCNHEILITVTTINGTMYQARYSNFSIASEKRNYTLTVAGYMNNFSTLRDSLKYSNGNRFSTIDKNTIGNYNKTCSGYYRGNGFWFSWNCVWVNLNGIYTTDIDKTKSNLDGIFWHNCNWLKFRKTEMKIRPNCISINKHIENVENIDSKKEEKCVSSAFIDNPIVTLMVANILFLFNYFKLMMCT